MVQFSSQSGGLSQNYEMEGTITIQGQMGKIPFQIPGKLSIFSVYARAHKKVIFKINKDGSLSAHTSGVLKLKIVVSRSI